MNTIRITHLKGACPDQRALFRATFPDGAPVTEESMALALAVGFDVSWLSLLLPEPAGAEYQRVTAPALAEYQRAIAAAGAEYQRAVAAAKTEYLLFAAPALAEYQRAKQAVGAEYQRAEQAAGAEYQRAIAPTLLPFLKSL